MKTKLVFTEEQLAEIKAARKTNKNKNADKRLRILELRASGVTIIKTAELTESNRGYVSSLVKRYFDEGLESIIKDHRKSNRYNMTFAEEEVFLEPYLKKAEAGQIVEVSEIRAAYEEKVGHRIGGGQIYYVLHRHGWRKVMPRSKHPNKATEEVIATSKKPAKESQEKNKAFL